MYLLWMRLIIILALYTILDPGCYGLYGSSVKDRTSGDPDGLGRYTYRMPFKMIYDVVEHVILLSCVSEHDVCGSMLCRD